MSPSMGIGVWQGPGPQQGPALWPVLLTVVDVVVIIIIDMCVWTHVCHSMCLETRGKHCGASPFCSPSCQLWDSLAVRLVQQESLPLSNLACIWPVPFLSLLAPIQHTLCLTGPDCSHLTACQPWPRWVMGLWDESFHALGQMLV